jgi:DNA-binding transcriptional regulator YhcF (GntR family)
MRLPGLGPTYRKVFVLIAAYADAGIPDPSWSELAGRAKVERKTIRNALHQLERGGLVRITHGDTTRHERDRYEITDRAALRPRRKRQEAAVRG